MSSSADMAALGAFAQQRLDAMDLRIDLWINNAGEVTRKTLLADVDAEEVLRVVGARRGLPHNNAGPNPSPDTVVLLRCS